MSTRSVTTQAALDAALADPDVDWIDIKSDKGVWLEIRATGSATVRAFGAATVRATGSATVRAFGAATVRAFDSATVRATGAATVHAFGAATVHATGAATVRAFDSATVRAFGSATVHASDSATVHAFDAATVHAFGSATVHASGSATVHATGAATVRASGSATVHATGSATVHATGAATVRASGSATVHASDSATVHASDSATVRATPFTAVHLHSGRVDLTGGVVIDHTKVDLTDAQTWCDYHGVEVVDGMATVFKAVDQQFQSGWSFDYSPGSTPEAPDWRDTDECGYGLHFGPSPSHALAYYSSAGEPRFLRVGVLLDTLRPISGSGTAKCKAPRVARPCVEVDVAGREISAELVSA